MNKKVIFVLCLLIAVLACVIAWAGGQGKLQAPDTTSQKVAAGPVDKGSFSTDLGKGLPYPGLTPAEIAKLNDPTRNKSQMDHSKKQKSAVKKTKSVPGSNAGTISAHQAVPINPKEKIDISTDSGKGKPYPGLSPQEQQKLQNAGGK